MVETYRKIHESVMNIIELQTSTRTKHHYHKVSIEKSRENKYG